MTVPGSLFKRATRWIRALAWVGAWAAVVASSAFLPLWGSIGLAVGVFAAQVLLPRRAAACHLTEGVTNGTSADG
jgi:hypothetical protein